MTLTDYRNFDLLITRAGEHYRAFVVDAPTGEASIIFDLPFGPDELTRLGGLAGVRRHIGVAVAPSLTAFTPSLHPIFQAPASHVPGKEETITPTRPSTHI